MRCPPKSTIVADFHVRIQQQRYNNDDDVDDYDYDYDDDNNNNSDGILSVLRQYLHKRWD